MIATVSHQRTIQVYLLAAPEDEAVCKDITKHLKPIIRNSSIPINIDSDFNIPGGMDVKEYQQRLYDADIVLVLISVDFLDDDNIQDRNQKVIERYNNGETRMIPILVRNCVWTATPFSMLPMVPRNQKPLNDKQFWNSPDDAVMAVVDDIHDAIIDSILDLNKTAQPSSAPQAENVPVQNAPMAASSLSQFEPPALVKEPIQAQVEVLQPAPVEQVESVPAQFEPPASAKEPIQAQVEAPQPAPVEQVESIPAQVVPPMPAKAMVQAKVEAAQPAPAIQVDKVSAPPVRRVTATSAPSMKQTKVSSPIAADWRKKYYRTVMMKRAGAILLDYIFVFIVSVIVLIIIDPNVETDALAYVTLILYYVIMPIMESSKWQGTIGKRILKLQITNKDGERITFLRAFWRNIVRSLVLYSYIFVIPLIIQYFRFTNTRKLFHDELSGTVIGERLASSGEVKVAASAA